MNMMKLIGIVTVLWILSPILLLLLKAMFGGDPQVIAESLPTATDSTVVRLADKLPYMLLAGAGVGGFLTAAYVRLFGDS